MLKKGGKLLVYDANWHLHFFDEEMFKRVTAREEKYFQKYGEKEIVAINNQDFFRTAPLTKCQRPKWDKNVLEKMGMYVSIQNDIGDNVYEQWEKDLYGESPLFEICAIKPF